MTTLFDPSIVHQAMRIVSNNSEHQYGHPAENFTKIAVGWEQIFNVQITGEQVALAMMWLKIMRETTKHKQDNLIDIIGYVLTLDAVRNHECDNNTSEHS